jgi:hypothetical protein
MLTTMIRMAAVIGFACAAALGAPLARAEVPGGLSNITVSFARGHRRDRPEVHSEGHPDSDTVYRVDVTAGVAGPVSVTRVQLRKDGAAILDVSSLDDAEVDLATIADDDQATPPPDYDGSYELTLTLSSGATFRGGFVATGMNSATVPQFASPPDCGLTATDQPRFTWANSAPQAGPAGETHALNLELVIHTDPWHDVLSAELPVGTTAFQVGRDLPGAGLHLAPGPYRDVVTESFAHVVGDIHVVRSAWTARAFVVGVESVCD